MPPVAAAGALLSTGLISSWAAVGVAAASTTFGGIIGLVGAGGIGSFLASTALSLVQSVLTQGRRPQPNFGSQSTERIATVRDSARPRFFGFGRIRTGGQIVFQKVSSAGDLWRVIVFDCGETDGVDFHFMNNEAVTLDGSGWATSPAKWAGNLRIAEFTGTDDQSASSLLTAAFPSIWTSAHRLRGLSYVVIQQKPVQIEDVNETWPSGPAGENWNAVRRASNRIYDPRDASTGYSDNPALVLLWVLRNAFGGNLSLDDFALDAWEAAADACDTEDATPEGGVEPRYRAAGLWEAAGAGTGTSTLAGAVNDLLQAMNARLYLDPDDDGRLGIVVDKPATNAEGPFVAADVLSLGLQPGQALLEDYDATSADFQNPELGFQDDTTPAWPYTAGELIANGTFDADLTGWTTGAGAPSVSGGELVLDGTGSPQAAQSVVQDVAVFAGRTYRLSLTATSGAATVRIGTTADDDALSETAVVAASPVAAQTISVVPTESPMRITLRVAAGGAATLDDVTLSQAPPSRVRKIAMPYVPSRNQAARLAKFEHLRLNAETVMEVTMNLAGYLVRPGDVVTFDIPELPGDSATEWLIEGDFEMGPSDSPGIRFACVQLDPEWAVWDGATELTEQAYPPAVDDEGAAVAAPSSLRAAATSDADTAGTVRLAWDVPGGGISAQIEWTVADAGAWGGRVTVNDATAGAGTILAAAGSPLPSLVDLRVRFQKLGEGVTDWAVLEDIDPATEFAAEAAPTLDSDDTDNAAPVDTTVQYYITPDDPATVWKVRLFVDAVQVGEEPSGDGGETTIPYLFDTPGTFAVTATTVNVSGVESATSSTITMTIS